MNFASYRFISMLLIPLMFFSILLAEENTITTTRYIAITFDDLPLGASQVDVERTRKMTEKLLGVLKAHNIKALGFVNEEKLYRKDTVDERIDILRMWLDAGMELGNHTFSHPSITRIPLQDYQDDVIRGETVTRMLLEEVGDSLKYFRHPFLRTGLTMDVKLAFEEFLAKRNYIISPVTIENWDYVYAQIYRKALQAGNQERMEKTARAYLEFTEQMFEFFESASRQILGYDMKHTLLLHANEINADYMDEMVDMMIKRGYQFISQGEALEDPAYAREDKYVGPAGVQWLFRWDFSSGDKKVDWKTEPTPPEYIMQWYRE